MKGTRKKTKTGVVVSNKMDKTAVVAVERRLRHSMYGKVIRRTPHFYAHDGKNQCGEESRPLSKTKRWRVVEIVKKAQ